MKTSYHVTRAGELAIVSVWVSSPEGDARAARVAYGAAFKLAGEYVARMPVSLPFRMPVVNVVKEGAAAARLVIDLAHFETIDLLVREAREAALREYGVRR